MRTTLLPSQNRRPASIPDNPAARASVPRVATALGLVLLFFSLPSRAQLSGPREAPTSSRSALEVDVQRLDLREAIERALRVDPQVRSTIVSSDRSDLAVLRAQLDRVSLKVDASLSEQWRATHFLALPSTDGGAETSGSGSFSLSANLQVPIFSGYRITATVDRAKHLQQAARASVQQTARSIALEVLRSYWAIRRVELQQRVSEQALHQYEEAVGVVRARMNAGLAPPVDLNRMEIRRLREQARLADLQGAAEEGRVQLAVALQLGGKRLELTEAAEVPSRPPEHAADVERWLDEARRQRAELSYVRSQLLSGMDQIRMIRSAYYPQLTGMMLLQYGNNPLYSFAGSYLMGSSANPFSELSGSFLVGATLSINLFDMWSTKTSLRDARYVVAQSQQEERRLGQTIESEVRTVHARLVRLYRIREFLLKSLAQAKDTLEIIARRYTNGDALILEYLDAQFELFNTEMELAESSAAVAQAWSELQAATGRMPGAFSSR